MRARPSAGFRPPPSCYAVRGLACAALALLAPLAQALELRIPSHEGSNLSCDRAWRGLRKLMPDLVLTELHDPVTAARRDRLLLDGTLDMDCGTIAGVAGLSYSAVSVYTVKVVLVARADDKQLQVSGPADLRRVSREAPLLLNRGSQLRLILEKLGVNAMDDAGAHTDQNIAKLLAGHGRLFVYQQPGLNSKLKAFQLEGKVRVLPWSPASIDYHMAYSPHLAPATVARLEAALAQLARNGELNAAAAGGDPP